MKKIIAIVLLLMPLSLQAEVVTPPGVRLLNKTFVVRQGIRALATHDTPDACEADAASRTVNAGPVQRIFQVKTGMGLLISTQPTLALCQSTPQERLAANRTKTSGSDINSCVVTTRYSSAFQPPSCVSTFNYVARYQPNSTPPPSCPPIPAPREENCPSGTLGTFEQTATMGPAPDCVITWSSPQADDCPAVPASNTAPLSWTPPTRNVDGSTLTNLAGFRIVYGQAADQLTRTIQLVNPSQSRFTVENLSPGQWYFAVKAYTANGTESARSAVWTKTVQ